MTRLTGQSAFDWEHYIKLSESLVLGTDESQWRCSVSRAYYGVFCVARNKEGLKTHKHNVHSTVINRLKTSKNTKKVNIGIVLEELKKFRERADYREHAMITQAVAKDKVEKARNLLNDIFQCYGNRNY
jgi:uncharacterized protein (UPF0332 family)